MSLTHVRVATVASSCRDYYKTVQIWKEEAGEAEEAGDIEGPPTLYMIAKPATAQECPLDHVELSA
jgi:hypothetical protein